MGTSITKGFCIVRRCILTNGHLYFKQISEENKTNTCFNEFLFPFLLVHLFILLIKGMLVCQNSRTSKFLNITRFIHSFLFFFSLLGCYMEIEKTWNRETLILD